MTNGLIDISRNRFDRSTYSFRFTNTPENLRPFFYKFYTLGHAHALPSEEYLMQDKNLEQTKFLLCAYLLSSEPPKKETIDRFVQDTVRSIEKLLKEYENGLVARAKRRLKSFFRSPYQDLQSFLSLQGVSISPEYELFGFLEKTHVNVRYRIIKINPLMIECSVLIEKTASSNHLTSQGLIKLEQLVKTYDLPIDTLN